jgi:hypothetical protein
VTSGCGLAASTKQKGGNVSRNAYYVRFAVLVAILAAFAVFMGVDPWGPW